jgi:hypothetical protein
MTKELYRVMVEYRELATGRTSWSEIRGVSRLRMQKILKSVGTQANGVEIYSADAERV